MPASALLPVMLKERENTSLGVIKLLKLSLISEVNTLFTLGL